MENGTKQKMIVFQMGYEEYAVDVQQVQSIEKVQPIRRVPETATFVEGVINLRGVIIPIIDLRVRLGMEKKEYTDATRIIIVYVEEMHIGLIVDNANDVVDIEKAQIESPPEVVGSVHADYVLGVVKYDARLFILLDLTKILTSVEIKTLKSKKG